MLYKPLLEVEETSSAVEIWRILRTIDSDLSPVISPRVICIINKFQLQLKFMGVPWLLPNQIMASRAKGREDDGHWSVCAGFSKFRLHHL